MRHNAGAIVDAVGLNAIAVDAGMTLEAASSVLARIETSVETLPESEVEHRLDDVLVRAAVDIAIGRHAGSVETVYTAQGPVQVQRGKDLSEVGWLIGTGGALVHSREPASVLRAGIANSRKPQQLRPRAPRLAIDADYLLFAAGLLAQVDPVAAFDCASRHLRLVE